MFKKKYMILLSLILVSLCALSCVSASEDADATVAIDDADIDPVEASVDEGLETNVEDGLSGDETETLTVDNSNDDKVSSPSYDEYEVEVSDKTIHNWQNESVRIYIIPSDDYYAYYFYVNVYDSDNNPVLDEKNIYSTEPADYVDYVIPERLGPGEYKIEITNYADDYILSTAKLTVSYDAVISAENYNAYYNSGVQYSIRVTELDTGLGLSGASIKIVFSNSKNTYTRYYTSGSDGYIKFDPKIPVGTYTVTISSNNAHVIADSIVKSATVKKSSVSMSLAKASSYQGCKLTLKATVKSQGRNVNEGTVKFTINGKTYSVAVKNGVATKSIKLKKVKTYKYTATFVGDNFNTKKVAGKAKVNKRYATKIVIKNKKGYYNTKKTITVKVKTKSGKKVKDGYIYVGSSDSYSKVKNGKAKLYVTFSGNYKKGKYSYSSGFTFYFKKSVSTKFKLKYVPKSLKYKASSKKFKITSKYRCPDCHKKSSHSHTINGYNVKIKGY